MKKFNPKKNYESTRKQIGYVSLREASDKDYRRIGFKSGLEVHQQLMTESKLFCRCPAGIYHDNDDYNAEVIRHMRPTLSELGEYDGTALMEFKTRKDIIYRLNNENACTYEVDDTPPFPIDRKALDIALEISLLCKLNIVGEVHITRKQYLDGSIPTGFQRTAILGVEGEIEISNKKIRLIQLSIEEDSCREISDIGHTRIYKTDRLGMPLIETVTYPDMLTPWELAEAAEYIRYLNRSTGKVRTGIGAGREDVNVSCEGGSRVEIKGVAHNSWIPELSHNEAFRQYALLNIRDILNKRIDDSGEWKAQYREIRLNDSELIFEPVKEAFDDNMRVFAIRLPKCQSILSHFTQPGKIFADEISDRLKVIACIEKPNMTHSEEPDPLMPAKNWGKISNFLDAEDDDAIIMIWGPSDDIPTALETVEERIQLAFSGVPNETRKSFPDGTTIFERVLPGKDRMYPDTDSAPIPLHDDKIEKIRSQLPEYVADRIRKMREWDIPEDTFKYILSKNLYPLIVSISEDFGFSPRETAIFFGHRFKNIEGKMRTHKNFNYDIIYKLFEFIKTRDLHPDIALPMAGILYEHPRMRHESILTTLNFKKKSMQEVLTPTGFLYKKFKEERRSGDPGCALNWLMGQLRNQAMGNVDLSELKQRIEQRIKADD
ncbi:MAG: Glu-tRNA(Gln) amidotransferase subunit GatE [Bacteroidales bacterium]|nr:Glu-tRNA(Gln) amidotransferase subunit GatE [Bacteroidales bacterium]